MLARWVSVRGWRGLRGVFWGMGWGGFFKVVEDPGGKGEALRAGCCDVAAFLLPGDA
jgi:hypothetical protein